MKKVFMMMALAGMVLFAITACDKSDDDGSNSGGNTDSNVTLTAPPFKAEAMNLNISGGGAEGIWQLRMMESGAYMITRDAQSASTRAGSDDLSYEFGKYTYTGGQYKFDNGMTISFEPSGTNYEVTITLKNSTTIKTTGTADTSASVTTGVMTDNLCSRPWTIEKVIASGKFEGVKLGKEFMAPINLANVKAWFEENGGKLKDQFDANTIILGIYFDSKGLFTINYQNRNADVGVWRWTDMNAGSLIYTWNDKLKAISLFSGNASVAFEKNPEKCKLTLMGSG
mgnify:CR=1 FL=1